MELEFFGHFRKFYGSVRKVVPRKWLRIKKSRNLCFLVRKTRCFVYPWIKALTAEDLNSHTVQQFDFRSNLKRSKTNENLSDLKFENSDSEKELIDPELDAKLKNIRQKIEPPSLEEASNETDSVFTSVTSVHDELQPESNTTLDLIG